MALEAGVPIVPLATVGGFRTLPPGSLRLHPGRYTILLGSPVDPKAYPDREALLKAVHDSIKQLVATAKERQA